MEQVQTSVCTGSIVLFNNILTDRYLIMVCYSKEIPSVCLLILLVIIRCVWLPIDVVKWKGFGKINS